MYFDWGTKKNGDMKNQNKNKDYTKKGDEKCPSILYSLTGRLLRRCYEHNVLLSKSIHHIRQSLKNVFK